jgi:hypothetical protein
MASLNPNFMKEMSEYLSNIHHRVKGGICVVIHLGGELPAAAEQLMIDSVQPYLAVIQPLCRKFIEDLLEHPLMGFYFF